MKTTRIYLIAAVGLLFAARPSMAQVTQATNAPINGNYVGFNQFSPYALPIRNDGDPRIHISSNLLRKITIDELPVWNGLNGLSETNVQRTSFGLRGDTTKAWSMLHLIDNKPYSLVETMKRDWMNVGTSYTANQDFLYTGLLERPGPEGNGLRTDAAFAWGCQDGAANADNMRFIFLQPTDMLPAGPASAEQGLEIMRLHPKGNVGIGSDFSNTLMPHRRLTVRNQSESPQLRIEYEGDASPSLGIKADFQVSSSGNLHVKPSDQAPARTVAIGFLQGEASDPINNSQVQTALDVGGITRIRKIPNDHAPDCLVAGYKASGNIKDNFLIRIDFPQDPDLVLNGVGDWISVTGGGNDFDWETDGHDVWTGHGLNGYPDRDVTVGGIPGTNAQFAVIDNFDVPNRSGIAVNITAAQSGLVEAHAVTARIIDHDQNFIVGVDGTASGGTTTIGGRFTSLTSSGAKNLAGVAGYCSGIQNQGFKTEIIGVYGSGTSTGNAAKPIGVYGLSIANGNITGLGGIFVGNLQASSTIITLSDVSTKNNVQALSGATEILTALSPKTYNYDWEPVLGLASGDTGTVCGFMAQDVQDVFPAAVAPYYQPARYDTTGVLIHESVDLLGLKYDEFIPLLVAGFQEQNAALTAQEATIAEQNETK